jgi:hypothetical protein
MSAHPGNVLSELAARGEVAVQWRREQFSKEREIVETSEGEWRRTQFSYDDRVYGFVFRSGLWEPIGYDVQIRRARAAANEPQIAKRKLERRADLYHEAWLQAGKPPSWTAEQFHREAQALFPTDPLLLGKIQDRTKRAAAKAARAKR